MLDVRVADVEDSIRSELEAAAAEEVVRFTTLLSLRGVPLSIGYSFFRRSDAGWLEGVAHPGRNLPGDLVLGDHGIRLAHARVAVETSQCGQFEADRFGIAHRSPVFLAVCTEFCCTDAGDMRPVEVARVEYRGDLVRFKLEISPSSPDTMQAVWELTDRDAATTRPSEA